MDPIDNMEAGQAVFRSRFFNMWVRFFYCLIFCCLFCWGLYGCRRRNSKPTGNVETHPAKPLESATQKNGFEGFMPGEDITPDPGFVRCAKLRSPDHPVHRVKIGSRAFQRRGYRLVASRQPPESSFCFGAVGGAYTTSEQIRSDLSEFATAVSSMKCRGILVLGNMGRHRKELEQNYITLAAAGLPLFILPGASEHMKRYEESLEMLSKRGVEVVDLARVRLVEWSDMTLLSVPGHHKHQPLGSGWWACGFTHRDVYEMMRLMDHKGSKKPVLLVSHASPLTSFAGPRGIDIGYGGAHGGSRALTLLASFLRIGFSVNSQIDEAGPAGLNPIAKKRVPEEEFAPALWLHPGAVKRFEGDDGNARKRIGAIMSFRNRGDVSGDSFSHSGKVHEVGRVEASYISVYSGT